MHLYDSGLYGTISSWFFDRLTEKQQAVDKALRIVDECLLAPTVARVLDLNIP